jgi:hypothetical protein
MSSNKFNCEAFALQHITTIEEVKQFAHYLVNEMKVNIHPDDDFVEYVDVATGQPFFTKDESFIGNRLMDECFSVCNTNNVDIYELFYTILHNSIAIQFTE